MPRPPRLPGRGGRTVLKNCLKLFAAAVGLLTPGVAAAAIDVLVVTNLNLRTGPGAEYERIDTIEAGSVVTVHECVID
jgi:uncharacterized protein YraI